jgi:hypothetical protein
MNGHEERARQVKALQLTAVLRKAGAQADDFDEGGNPMHRVNEWWEMAAKTARVNPPSDATKRMVVAMLKASEGEQPADPFANL